MRRILLGYFRDGSLQSAAVQTGVIPVSVRRNIDGVSRSPMAVFTDMIFFSVGVSKTFKPASLNLLNGEMNMGAVFVRMVDGPVLCHVHAPVRMVFFGFLAGE